MQKLVLAVLGLSLAFLMPMGAAVATTGTWSATGSLGSPRWLHTATPLASGKVLVAGGYDSSATPLRSTELYDPVAGTWSATGTLTTGRIEHTATLLASGKVLIAGGYNPTLRDGLLASAEIYDPATETWSATGRMTTARMFHTATLLPSGKVLVTGGFIGAYLVSAELYDPVLGTWSLTGSMTTSRNQHTATLLQSGKVLVVGGDYVTSAEVYDPLLGTWSATSSMSTTVFLQNHTATRLLSGQVLVSGGYGSSAYPPQATSASELYDPASDTWRATGAMNDARTYHTATLLPSGEVLVTGGSPGIYSGVRLASAELYDAVTGAWSATGSMTTGRVRHTASFVYGKVLAAGGYASEATASAELYTFVTPTPPLIDVTQSPAPNAEGWNNSDITVTWNVSDPMSGIVSTNGCDTTTITAETAGTTFTCSALNGAGLTASASVLIKIDKTAPTITFSGNTGTYTVDQTIFISCVASDALSGIATTSCPAVASGPATDYVGTTATTSTTLIATATDKAGNSATASTTFTVTVTADGICRLSASLATAHDICTKATSIAIAPNDRAKAGKLQAFDSFLAAQSGKSIPADLATLLSRLAHLL